MLAPVCSAYARAGPLPEAEAVEAREAPEAKASPGAVRVDVAGRRSASPAMRLWKNGTTSGLTFAISGGSPCS